MKHKYHGRFSPSQIAQEKTSLRGSIFFLLLCVDPNTKGQYEEVDVDKCFEGLLYKTGGLNSLLFYPFEMVEVMSLLEAARAEFNNPDFNFKVYRKLILDAGAEVLKIKEV